MLLTSNELALWQDRAVNGPFRVAGDFSPNSPGHWSEMAAAMSLNFSSQRWEGPSNIESDGSVALDTDSNSPPNSHASMVLDMYSAALAARTVGDVSVMRRIITEIEYQATRPTLDYGSRTLWPFNKYNDLSPLFKNAAVVRDFVLAYDMCRSMGETSSVAEQWFLDMAELCEQIIHANLAGVFPNRKSDSYVSRASFVNGDHSFESHRLANGTIIRFPRVMRFYNNRRSNLAGTVGIVGALMENQFYIDEFKRYMRELVMFGTRTGTYGGWGDYNRGRGDFPQLGLHYGMHGMEGILPAMEAIARQGDTSLYEFSSSDGSVDATWGTAQLKTMEEALDQYLKWVAQTWPAQYTDGGSSTSSAIAGDPFYLVQSLNTGNGRALVNDGHFMYAALYYNRADWADIINRVGTPTGFTSSVQATWAWTGWRQDRRNRFTRSLSARPDYS